MKLKTGKQIFYSIFVLLLSSVQAAAMFSNNMQPVEIQNNTGQFTEITNQPVAVTGFNSELANHELRVSAGQKKQSALMEVIKKLDWADFEWSRLKDYLLHHMFELPTGSSVSLESQRYKVTFLEMTQGNDGEEIINNIVAQIVRHCSLQSHEAFFLVFNAILNHVDQRNRRVHPNGNIAQQLEAANRNYTGAYYQPPKFSTVENNLEMRHITKCLEELQLMQDLSILNITLVNKANVLVQLFQHYSGIKAPVQLLSAQNVSVATFINAYPASFQRSRVFMWLIGHRFDFELKQGGGFYQGEVELRQTVKQKMLELHNDTEYLQLLLAIMAVDCFGFNYLTDSKATVAAKVIIPVVDTMREDLFAGYTLKPGSTPTSIQLMELRDVNGVFDRVEEIARIAGVGESELYAISRDYSHSTNEQNFKMLRRIVSKYGSRSIFQIKTAFEKLKLRDGLLKLRAWFYEYTG
ncbi:MAG: death domain-containing protein [Endozoicomonadaceae bacterium]|nr:death domain-containing protein [Endozoicomonadaceae bacterium]